MGLHRFFHGYDKSDIQALFESDNGLKVAVDELKTSIQVLFENDKELFNKWKQLLENNKELSEKLQQWQESLSGHLLQCNETAENAEKLVAAPAEQALQLSEMAGDSDKIMLICTVASAAAVVIMASFIGFCIYQGIKHEREENQNLLPETGMSSSKASSVSDLVALDRV